MWLPTVCWHLCPPYNRPREEESDEEYAATERDSEMEDESTIAEQEDHEKATTDYTNEISALQQEGRFLQTSSAIKWLPSRQFLSSNKSSMFIHWSSFRMSYSTVATTLIPNDVLDIVCSHDVLVYATMEIVD